MKRILILSILFFIEVTSYSQPKIVSECTVEYSVTASEGDINWQQSLKNTFKTVYIKGTKSKVDLISSSPSYSQTTFLDLKKDSVVVLREFGNNKFMTYLNENKLREQNSKYEGIQFKELNESKTILGYDCKKLIAQLKDGSYFTLFYTSSIIASNKMFEYQFKDVPGFVLEYELVGDNSKGKITYTATKINFNPIHIQTFDLPKSGYRIL